MRKENGKCSLWRKIKLIIKLISKKRWKKKTIEQCDNYLVISHAYGITDGIVMQRRKVVIIDEIFGARIHQNAITPSWTSCQHIVLWQCRLFFVRIRWWECNRIFNEYLFQWLQFKIKLLQLKSAQTNIHLNIYFFKSVFQAYYPWFFEFTLMIDVMEFFFSNGENIFRIGVTILNFIMVVFNI